MLNMAIIVCYNKQDKQEDKQIKILWIKILMLRYLGGKF